MKVGTLEYTSNVAPSRTKLSEVCQAILVQLRNSHSDLLSHHTSYTDVFPAKMASK